MRYILGLKLLVQLCFARTNTECVHVFSSQNWNMSKNFNKPAITKFIKKNCSEVLKLLHVKG